MIPVLYSGGFVHRSTKSCSLPRTERQLAVSRESRSSCWLPRAFPHWRPADEGTRLGGKANVAKAGFAIAPECCVSVAATTRDSLLLDHRLCRLIL